MQYAVRGMKSPPKFNPETDENKINKFDGNMAGYFDDLMRRRPATSGGFINLPSQNFKLMVERSKSKEDLAALVDA